MYRGMDKFIFRDVFGLVIYPKSYSLKTIFFLVKALKTIWIQVRDAFSYSHAYKVW